MAKLLHNIFVIIVNIIGWGGLISFLIGVIAFIRVMFSNQRIGSNPNDPNHGSGMPWG